MGGGKQHHFVQFEISVHILQLVAVIYVNRLSVDFSSYGIIYINHIKQHVHTSPSPVISLSVCLRRPFTCSVPWPSSVMTTSCPPWRSCVRYECEVLKVLKN